MIVKLENDIITANKSNIMGVSLIFIILLFIGITSCNSQPEKNKSLKKFECKEIGWSFEYPADWPEMTKEEIALIESRGKSALEKTVGENIEMTEKNILWLKKDPFNSFTSTMQPVDSMTAEQHGRDEESLNRVIVDTYKAQGIEFDHKISKKNIDGLEFHVFEAAIYSPDRKNIIMNQMVFDRLINGKLTLTLALNYNNEKDKESLLRIINTSKLIYRN